MKFGIIFLFSTLVLIQAKAQFLGGLFSQQATKRKVMLEQIAGMQIYLGALKNGYRIADKGLNTAQQLKNGTFDLHTAYFSSLQKVNPVVANNPKGKAIAKLQQQVTGLFMAEIRWQKKEKLLNASEMSYLQKVSENLLNQVKLDIEELEQVLVPGKLELTDQERLDRIDHLYANTKDKYAFAGYFTSKCRALAASRKQAQREKQQIKKWYGIH
jgi:hypothetical protein